MYRRGLILLLALMPLLLHGQPKETTVIFHQTEWNFGTIKEQDGKVSHAFKYTNSGDSPLIFYSVNASCGCTTPSYRKEPLKAGESAEITITYDPANRPGRFEKNVVIQGNMEGNIVVLKIKGVVEARPRGIEDDYPIFLSKGIRLSDSQMAAGAIPNTHPERMVVKFYNTSDKNVKVGFGNSDIPSWLKVDDSKIVAPKSECTMAAVLIPTKDMYGHRSVQLPIIIEDNRQPIEMMVSADFTEDFSQLSEEQRSKAPYIILSSYFYSFSDCSSGEKLRREFTITNKGRSTLTIRYLDFDTDKLKVSVSRTDIPPTETAKIVVDVDSSIPREIAEVVRIISNDPVYPVREIRIIANVL